MKLIFFTAAWILSKLKQERTPNSWYNFVGRLKQLLVIWDNSPKKSAICNTFQRRTRRSWWWTARQTIGLWAEIDAVWDFIEGDRCLTTEIITNTISITIVSAHEILSGKLNTSRLFTRWVPKVFVQISRAFNRNFKSMRSNLWNISEENSKWRWNLVLLIRSWRQSNCGKGPVKAKSSWSTGNIMALVF